MTIKCSSCGKPNPDILEVCQFCDSPLKKPDQEPLRPGENPTKKDTGELEPILPEWLREVRQQARDSAADDASKKEEARTKDQDEAPDLLAGLASQAGRDEDEVPDWLADLSGGSKKPSAPMPAAEPEPDFLSSLRPEEPAEAAPVTPQEEVAPWLADLGSGRQSPTERKDELSEWFNKASEQPSASFTLEPGAPTDDLSWMHAAHAESAPVEPEPLPEELSWMRDLDAQKAAPPPAEPPPSPDDLSWMHESPTPFAPEQPAGISEDLGWLKNLEISAPENEPELPQPRRTAPLDQNAPESVPDWLVGLTGKTTAPSSFETAQEPPQPNAEIPSLAQESGLPDWMTGEPGAPSAQQPPLDELPDWLAPLGNEIAQQEVPSTDQPVFGSELPPWLSNLQGIPAEQAPPPSAAEAVSAEPDFFLPSTPSFEAAPEPAFAEEVDNLLNIEMPDWLKGAAPVEGQSAAPVSEMPAPSAGEEALIPVELPSWVQAMRPVEAVLSETGTDVGDQVTEKQGPLAGLRGVLPATPGLAPTSKPKAYSLKLQASTEQQSSAAMLEQILTSETTARPISTAKTMASQRVLRWVLTALFMLVLGSVLFARTQMMQVSASLPLETYYIIQSKVIENIPEGAPVLAVFDYEPSTAGELEAAGGPLMDSLLLLRHPRLTFVSTSANGPALAERFMSNTQADYNYQAGQQYINLGYLPGGAAGVLGFVLNPVQAIPFSADGQPAWQSAPLQGVTRLSDFAAVILLTDHVESGRTWVEQTRPSMGDRPLLVVTSAQVGPLLQPYVLSRQVTGMITGLSGGAGYELINNGRPGLARNYWDAFGVGLLMAVLMIVFGALGNFMLGLRARRTEQEGR